MRSQRPLCGCWERPARCGPTSGRRRSRAPSCSSWSPGPSGSHPAGRPGRRRAARCGGSAAALRRQRRRRLRQRRRRGGESARGGGDEHAGGARRCDRRPDDGADPGGDAAARRGRPAGPLRPRLELGDGVHARQLAAGEAAGDRRPRRDRQMGCAAGARLRHGNRLPPAQPGAGRGGRRRSAPSGCRSSSCWPRPTCSACTAR